MGLFDFLSGKQKEESTNETLFSKLELEHLIKVVQKIGDIFRDSKILVGGRNITMMDRMHSYVGMLGFYYENIYKFGNFVNLVNEKIASRYVLIELAMSDTNNRTKSVNELADNWSDVLQVIYNLQLEPNESGDALKAMNQDIEKVTEAFEKLSNKKCRKPKNPFNVKPRVTTYNPYNICEDIARSYGHVIPDITDVFMQELGPKIIMAEYSSIDVKDIVANYAIEMIKSYYNNAGFVPMVIVDQILGQIDQVVAKLTRISYAPHGSLKEYILSKIYR